MSDYASLYKSYMQVYKGFTFICQGTTWRIEDNHGLVAVADSPEAARAFIDAAY